MAQINTWTVVFLSVLFSVFNSKALHADPPSGSNWEPIAELTDEFEGDKLDSTKWHDHNPDWQGRRPAFFSSNNVTVSDGKLKLTARAEDLKDLPKGYHTFTTAAVKSKALVKYGYFEIKSKAMKSKASSNFWFYNNTKEEWTEIDVFEICGLEDKTDNICYMTLHVFHTPTEKKHLQSGVQWKAPFKFTDDYHVYALKWGKKAIKWYVDGKVVRETKNTHWHQPLHMNFDSETYPEWFGLPKKENLPSTYDIEYIRSWRKKDTAAPKDSADKNRNVDKLKEEFLKWKFGMFIHFNVATFNNREWATGYEDPATFAPDKLDCSQWADAADAAGMKYAVLTVKHTGGWCLWDSKHTAHDITAFANYKNGKGDIAREFVEAFRKKGLKVGFYYCLPGNFSTKKFSGTGLPEGATDLNGLPPEAKDDYVGFIKKQLAELLTNYGPIDLVWIDQYLNGYTGKQWAEIKAHIHALQPDCLVVANNSLIPKDTDIYSYEYPWLKANSPGKALPPQGNKFPSEVSDCICSGWFWKDDQNEKRLQSAEDIFGLVKLCNSRQSTFLLNVPPDKSGLIPSYSVKRLQEIGELLKGENKTSD